MLVKCPKCKQEFDIEIELNLIENEEEIENKEVDIERAMEQLAEQHQDYLNDSVGD